LPIEDIFGHLVHFEVNFWGFLLFVRIIKNFYSNLVRLYLIK
jgi:hypothetical protein